MALLIARHRPEAGGYLVEYADGYQSYSPAQAFEEGYTSVDGESAETAARVATGTGREQVLELR